MSDSSPHTLKAFGQLSRRVDFRETLKDVKKEGNENVIELCRVMAVALATDETLHRTKADIQLAEVLPAVPWLVPIIGSGCYANDEVQWFQVQEILTSIYAQLEPPQNGGWNDGTLPRGLTRLLGELGACGVDPRVRTTALVESLALERREGGKPPEQAGTNGGISDGHSWAGDGEPLSALALHFLVVAAHLAMLYRLAQLVTCHPPYRNQDDEVNLDQLSPPAEETEPPPGLRSIDPYLARNLGRVRQALIDACAEDVVKGLTRTGSTGDDPRNTLAKALKALAEATRTELGRGGNSLRGRTVGRVAEAAWYLATRAYSSYQGWSDLRFGLVMMTELKPPTVRIPWPNPRKPETPVDALTELLKGRASAGSLATDFYDSVAGVLWTQFRFSESARASELVSEYDLPLSVAFVSSFDLETELALWRTAERNETRGKQTFHMVMPVWAKNDGDGTVSPCWLQASVMIENDLSSEEALKRIQEPETWSLVESATTARRLLGGVGTGPNPGPFVIRTVGNPLVKLPAASKLTPKERDRLPKHNLFVHAITVDELTGLEQLYAEFFYARTDRFELTGGKTDIPLLGLPHALVDGGFNPRFWMGFGVPVSDSAVRDRLVSLIVPRASTKQIRSSGIFVNQRFSDDDQKAVQLFGLTMDRARVDEYTVGLRHYAQHLRDLVDSSKSLDSRLDQWPGEQASACTLPLEETTE